MTSDSRRVLHQNWKTRTQTMTMTTKVVICLVGCSRSPTEGKLRRETRRRSQPSSRMITMLHKMSKTKTAPRKESVLLDKIHPLNVKETMSSVDRSTTEDLQKEDSTLKKCCDRVGKPIIRENYIGNFFMKNHESVFSGHLGATPKHFLGRTTPGLH